MSRIARILRTIARLDVARIRYALWLRWHDLDFRGESTEDLGIPDWTAPHAASGGPDLHDVLDALDIPVGSRCIDFGSGKGIACITLRRYFEQVTGVELSAKLVGISYENLDKLPVVVVGVRFVCRDAGTFTKLDEFTHVYMFNPFPARVMVDVMANLRRSLERVPRRLTIIYKNPVAHEAVVAAGFFKVREFTFRDSHPFWIYEN